MNCGVFMSFDTLKRLELLLVLVWLLQLMSLFLLATLVSTHPRHLSSRKGDKVGSSEAALLAKLGIRPFSYGLVVQMVYDNGSVFSPEVLNLTEDDLMIKFASGVSNVTALALAISYPTIAAAPHMFLNAYKNVLAIAVATEYSFPQADKVKEYLEDPSKFAVAVAAPAAAAGGGAAPAAAAEEAKKEEPAEESDDDMGFSLFD
ncbi:hypothetical protein ABKV19_024162 [Rosa sericea]